jgi:hypothetical protein
MVCYVTFFWGDVSIINFFLHNGHSMSVCLTTPDF